jgi:hypothetical protein
MRTSTILLAIAAFGVGSTAALAQDTTIIRERSAPAVTIERPAVTIEKRTPDVTIERRSVETTGVSDCRTKTVRKEDATGSTTVKKETCD